MNMHTLLASLALSAGTLLAMPAHAADVPAAGTEDCIQLGSDLQLVRAGASRNILLRNGQDHYLVHFKDDCSKAGYSRKLTFVTDGEQGQVCGAGRTELRTDGGYCAVASVEPIDATAFKQKARQRSR
ncbi:hypothetical protein ACI703_10410 [Isoptericola jiangsuensis]|uniref:hypothetical protein n=1 Tax=Bacteria TaxID=2 RepID=UPI00190C3BC7|nr:MULTISPECIES: hypothetical protein [unclassified Stenotrophomonas]MBK0013761.1 hypothetical protein [Stenotrophomonas sp. S41]